VLTNQAREDCTASNTLSRDYLPHLQLYDGSRDDKET
jgi:hypothetical protein